MLPSTINPLLPVMLTDRQISRLRFLAVEETLSIANDLGKTLEISNASARVAARNHLLGYREEIEEIISTLDRVSGHGEDEDEEAYHRA